MKKKQLKAELKDAQKALEISNETIKIQVDRIEELKKQIKIDNVKSISISDMKENQIYEDKWGEYYRLIEITAVDIHFRRNSDNRSVYFSYERVEDFFCN